MCSLIKQFIVKLSSKEIFKVFSFTAMSAVIKMITNLVSVKVLAVFVGPSGVALLGQLINFSSIVQTIGSGGINRGVTKYTAEYYEQPINIKYLLSTSTKISIFLSVIIGFILIFFSEFLSLKILKTIEYSFVFVIFGFTLCFYTLNNQLLSILNGFKEYRKFVIVNIISSFVGLIFTVILVYLANIKGALIAAVTFQSITFFVSLFFVIKSPWFKKDFFLSKYNFVVANKLFHYSIMSIVSAFTVPISQILVRDFLTSAISLDAAGIWEGMNRISGMYLMLVTSSLGVYYLPKLSGIKTKKLLRKEIFNVYKFVLPIVMASIIIIFVSKELIVKLIFSDSFMEMQSLFSYQLIGDFFKISAWVLSFVLLAKAKTKLFIISEILFSLLFVILSFICISRFGLKGASIAYMLNYMLYFIIMVVIFRKLLFKKYSNGK